MKIASLALLSALSVCSLNQAYANDNSVFISYAGIKPKEVKYLNGVNVSYSHLFNDKWGGIGSFTFARSNESQPNQVRQKFDYYSFMVGPTYKVNSIFTVYAMGGIANINSKTDNDGYPSSTEKNSKNGLALGVGATANITDQFSVKVGYEYSRFQVKDEDGKNSISTNGFNVGIGYSF